MNVRKRNGEVVAYDSKRISGAIRKANSEMVFEQDRVTDGQIDDIIYNIEQTKYDTLSVEEIQDKVEKGLVAINKYTLAKAYILYRYKQEIKRKGSAVDDSIMELVGYSNRNVMEENSNKNAYIASTQRDLIAGEISKDLTKRVLLPDEIINAHEQGILHFHDMDYFLQNIFNCCLINIEDMLDNGTVMNGKLIESPKSFQVACTVMTQIIAAVASSQYGGQSVNIKYLGKYLRKTYDKAYSHFKHDLCKDDELAKELAHDKMMDELKSGVQSIQYQINTLMTTNGQSPFVTIFLHLDDSYEYIEEVALIIKEILRQREEGIKNERGVYITPAFPKLVYVLDENNIHEDSPYWDITTLALECSAKRMYPDYISAKKMRENYAGNIFSPMGCRSFLSPWKDSNEKYKWDGRFNQGVVSLNLPQIGIVAKGDEEAFWVILEDRLALCFRALMARHERLEGTLSDVSPIHWQHGAIARLKPGEKIDELLHGGYSTLSLGYIGLYEVTKLMTGETHTYGKGKEFALKLMKRLRLACDTWKKETGIGFALYGTPAESLCYRFAEIDRQKYGSIKDVTDKGYYTNSYHVDVREHIDAFSKFKFESEFQNISSGGAISYVEIPNIMHNTDVLKELAKFIYDNIQYAEFNTKSDYCHVCGFRGEITINKDYEWECPQCHNKDKVKMNVIRRTCGYIGENFWNVGKTKEIASRVLHL